MDTERELDEVLAALARVQISGAQQFAESKRRFLMLLRDDKAAAVAAERERCAKECEAEAELWRGAQDITDFRLCASRIRAGI